MITLIITMGVLMVKGIYPFGNARIDYYDMGQTNAPLYYHLYDFLHGKVSLFFDWYINEGQNLSMGSAIQWNISPFNLFFIFVKRNRILESLSLFTILRLVFMAFTMNLFLTKVCKKTPYFYQVIFSVLYSLCGYSLIHYTIPTYLDMAVFFPILVLSLFKLLKEGKLLFYTLTLGYTIALSYYLGFMNLIYILLVGGLYFLFILPKEERGNRAFRLGIGTIAGLSLSSVILLPAVFQMSKSTRFHSNLSGGPIETIISILNSIGADMYYVKWWLLFGMALPGVIILFGLFKKRKNIREKLFLILATFIPCALIPVESINILWHFGTYYHYPVRCGYLIPFAILSCAAYFAGETFTEKSKYEKRTGVLCIAGVFCGLLLSIGVLRLYLKHDLWYVKDLFLVSIGVFAVLFLIYFAIIILGKGKWRGILLIPIFFELIVGAYISYGNPYYYTDYSGDPEQSGEYIITANTLKESLPIEESFIDRIKNPDTDLNTNYSMVLNRATITGWANTVCSEQQNAAIQFGYGAHFMRILDSGGTYFTDSLLNVKEILTCAPAQTDASVYEKIAQANGYTLYKNMVALPFGLTVSDKLLSMDVYSIDYVEIQNEIYHSLSDDKGMIAERVPMEAEDDGTEFTVKIEGNKALYLQGGSFEKIIVNGQEVVVPSIRETDNKAYPAWFNSNVICLGNFNEETVTMEVVLKEGSPFNSKLSTLDLEKLNQLSNSYRDYSVKEQVTKSSLTLQAVGTEEKNLLLLPINYDEGFKITNNGVLVTNAQRVAGLFVGIPLNIGENEIAMRYTPPGLKTGALLTLITCILIAIVTSLNCKRQIMINRFFEKTASIILQTVWWGVAILLYIIPISWLIVHVIVKRL
ncbi:MAG: YfhO family protein [Lachnospiraceae bacterium]|nr:YfhO family protein [Lachnospiraceae bacterium]